MIKFFYSKYRAIKLHFERASLVRELETLYQTQAYIAQREKEIIRRAAQIDCESIVTKNQLARGW
jgi:hypothetical protein